MKRFLAFSLSLVCCGFLVFPNAALAQTVDVSLSPDISTTFVGQLVSIELVATSQGALAADVAAIEAILEWDPSHLELVGVENAGAGYEWLVSDFLLDPDGINDSHLDGDALLTALSQATTPASVPVEPGLVVTAVVFRTLAPTLSTQVSLVQESGQHASTRVLDFHRPGVELTGSVESSAEVVISPAVELGPSLDVHPGSCPNPIKVGSRGRLPVALTGSADFDVRNVDPRSLLLARSDGVGGAIAPKRDRRGTRLRVVDVSTPFMEERCDCHTLAGDGVDDLLMFFATQSVAVTLELSAEEDGSFVEVVLSGNLLDGSYFEATDCLKVRRRQSLEPVEVSTVGLGGGVRRDPSAGTD